jgi:HK97 family phage major capsid protein
MTRIEALRSAINAKADRANELRTTLHDHITRDGTPSDEERAQFDADSTEFEAIEPELERMRAELAQLERIANAPEQARERVGPTLIVRNQEDPLADGVEFRSPREVIATAHRAIERGVVELDDKYRAAAERTLRQVHGDRAAVARHLIVTGRESYRTAFGKMMEATVHGGAAFLTEPEQRAVEAVRAASLTGNAGGFAIPFTLDPTIIVTGAHDGEGSVWRQISRVVQITTDQWNGVSSAGVTASWDGEAGEVSDDAPTLAQPSIDVHKAQAFVPFSIEVGMDWLGMESDVRELFMIAKDDLESAAFASAAAPSNNPQGLINALDGTTSELTPATAEAFALVDVDKTFNSLPRRHRRRASWMADVSTYTTIRALLRAANTGGSDEWVQTSANLPALAYGRPAYEEPAMRGTADINIAATADNFLLVFGDFSRYYIIDRVGMNVELIPHLFATGNNRPSGQRGLYMWWRVGAEPVDTNAFRVMNIATTA